MGRPSVLVAGRASGVAFLGQRRSLFRAADPATVGLHCTVSDSGTALHGVVTVENALHGV